MRVFNPKIVEVFMHNNGWQQHPGGYRCVLGCQTVTEIMGPLIENHRPTCLCRQMFVEVSESEATRILENRLNGNGPAPANDDVPDKAEEIARDFFQSDAWINSGLRIDEDRALADLLRKHHVGQPTPLAELFADPRLRPVVELVREAMHIRQLSKLPLGDMDEAVDALPPELRQAISPTLNGFPYVTIETPPIDPYGKRANLVRRMDQLEDRVRALENDRDGFNGAKV